MGKVDSISSRTRVVFVVMAMLAALLGAVLAGSQPAEASSHLVVQGYVNGDPDSPKYELHGGWVVGESITVTIYETAAKGTVLFTKTFAFEGAGPRGVGPSAPGNHFVVTQGADTLEFTLVDLEVDVDGVENTAFGTGPADLSLDALPAGEANICPRTVSGGGSWTSDYDDPVDNPDVPGCSPTWDLMPGDGIKVTDNGPTDGVDCCQTVSMARVIDFTDDNTSIFEEDITWLAQKAITLGCNPPANDRYCPAANVTRGQMATFLVRALGLTPSDDNGSFTDHLGSVHRMNINALRIAGITSGCAADKFCPGNSVTRAQMGTFLANAVGLTPSDDNGPFTDHLGSVHRMNINALRIAGITTGCAADKYCPGKAVTRAQMAAFLRRALG